MGRGVQAERLGDRIFFQTNQKGHSKINFDSEPGEKLEM